MLVAALFHVNLGLLLALVILRPVASVGQAEGNDIGLRVDTGEVSVVAALDTQDFESPILETPQVEAVAMPVSSYTVEHETVEVPGLEPVVTDADREEPSCTTESHSRLAPSGVVRRSASHVPYRHASRDTPSAVEQVQPEAPVISGQGKPPVEPPAASAPAAKTPAAGADSSPPVIPVIISRSDVEYPASAKRRRIQGTVMVRVKLGLDGVPMRVGLARSSGSGLLDDAALEAVAGWRYLPAVQNGSPIEFEFDQPVVFELKDGN